MITRAESRIDAKGLDFKSLNQLIRGAGEDIEITNCLGQRFIASGLDKKRIDIKGTPGNALGAYLNGARVTVRGNAQDAVGDTMNGGEIIIYGNTGDAAGYAMRGGRIYVMGNAGYRAGIHMKEFESQRPVIVIGGRCGSFLGEYQAGGVIIVLGLGSEGAPIVGNFPCTGMHGGRVILRSDCRDIRFPKNVNALPATDEDIELARGHISEYCGLFGCQARDIMSAPFTVITPDSLNPYKQMYIAN